MVVMQVLCAVFVSAVVSSTLVFVLTKLLW